MFAKVWYTANANVRVSRSIGFGGPASGPAGGGDPGGGPMTIGGSPGGGGGAGDGLPVIIEGGSSRDRLDVYVQALNVFNHTNLNQYVGNLRSPCFGMRHQRARVLQGNREFWSVADGVVVPVTAARHVVGGGTVRQGSLLFDVEVFAKDTTGLTEFAPRLAEPSEEVDYWSFFYTGDATARGVDVLVQQKVGRHIRAGSATRTAGPHTASPAFRRRRFLRIRIDATK